MRVARPRTLRGWLIAIMLSALVTSQLITFGALIAERRFVTATIHRNEAFRQIDNALQFLIAPRGRDELRTDGMPRSNRFRISTGDTPWIDPDRTDGELSDQLARALTRYRPLEVRVAKRGAPIQVREIVRTPPEDAEIRRAVQVRRVATRSDRNPLHASVRLPDRRWVNISVPMPQEPPFAPTLAIAALLSALCVTIAAVWAAGRLTRPLLTLTAAAEQVESNPDLPPVPEEGPEDVRRLAREFNAMVVRVRRILEEQQFLLRAIGHDLRTPLASLRIRLEFVDDEELRSRMARTISEMEQLTAAALDAARGGAVDERSRRIDLGALAGAVCDDAREMGGAVTFADAEGIDVVGRSSELRRAIQNLVDNGVRHGGNVGVSLRRDDRDALIVVEDDGPGIAEADLGRVMEPFVRLDSARNPDGVGGHGLGLTITRSIAERHRGRLVLAGRDGGGLVATLRLPAADPVGARAGGAIRDRS